MNKKILLLSLLPFALTSCGSLPSWMGGKKEEKPKLAGERITALKLSSELMPDPAAAAEKPNVPAAAANAEWPQHTGWQNAANANLTGGRFQNEHSARIGDGNGFSHTLLPRPVVANGAVFAMDASGFISAHKADDISTRLWKSSGVSEDDEEDLFGGGLAYDAGVLYATSGRGVIAAFDAASGKPLWRKQLPSPIRSAPRASGERLYVVTMGNVTYGLSAKTGETLWDHRGISEIAGLMSNVSPTLSGDDLLVPYSSGELFSLSAQDGREHWSDSLVTANHTQATDSFTGIGGDPVIDGEVVFATGNNGMTAAIHLPSGRRYWQEPAGSINTPWLAGNELYLLTSDNLLVDMVKFSGKVRWATPLASYLDPDLRLKPISWRGPVMVGGKLALVGSHGKMALVDAVTGALETISIPDDIYTAPVIANGRMYLVDKDARLYSLE